MFINLIRLGIISKSAMIKAMLHITKEKLNTKYKARRSTIQNVLSFDLFLNSVYKYKPTFCTYFTNHVAGMMHRYWRDLFPEDFGLDQNQIDRFHQQLILS